MGNDIEPLFELNQKLNNDTAYLKAVIENSLDGIIVTTVEGNIISYNNMAERIFGYSKEEIAGKHISTLIAPSEQVSYFGEFEEKLGQLQESKGITRGGDVFPMEVAVEQISTSDGVFFSGVVRDITIRKAYEDELKRANSELEEFAYRTSHDLRSPIVSSIALTEMTSQSVEEGNIDKARASLKHIHGSLVKLEALIRDILRLTQVNYDEELEEHFDMEELLRDSIQKMTNLEDFERLEISINVPFKTPVFLDKSRLLVVIENIISNAIKYQDKLKEHSYLNIDVEYGDSFLAIRFEDNGIGIPKEFQDDMFKMFKRFHPKVSFGSGLGMYMIKKSCEILNGCVDVVSGPEGTSFDITIPIDS